MNSVHVLGNILQRGTGSAEYFIICVILNLVPVTGINYMAENKSV